MILPIILGSGAFLIAIFLILNDKNEKFSLAFLRFAGKLGIKQDASAQRLFSALKGFLLIFCLVIVFATLVYYFG